MCGDNFVYVRKALSIRFYACKYNENIMIGEFSLLYLSK